MGDKEREVVEGEAVCFCRKEGSLTNLTKGGCIFKKKNLDFQNLETRFCSKSCCNKLHRRGIEKEGMFGLVFWVVKKSFGHFRDYHSD